MGFGRGILTERAWLGRRDDRDCERALLTPLCGIAWPTYRAVGRRLARGVSLQSYKTALYPIFIVHFLPPDSLTPSHLHEHGGRQGLFGSTWPQH
jgi:hypothetical protein